MTRRREGQLGFGQVVLFGLLGPPETLLDPALCSCVSPVR